MDRTGFSMAGVVVLVALAFGCSSNSGSPAAPAVTLDPSDSSLKVTAPVAQSPINDTMLKTLTPTLTVSAATQQYASVALQYRFQVFNNAGTLAQDSGLVNSPAWTTTQMLTPNTRFTWKARAEYQGAPGPWSTTASFTTPDPPPAYSKPIGPWEQCGSLSKKIDLVFCVWNAIRPGNTVDDFEVVKRVAWLLRGEGTGLLIKNGGEGVRLWQGYSFSVSRICYPDGHIYKIIIDAGAGGQNLPTFVDNDFVDPTLYVAAIDPGKP